MNQNKLFNRIIAAILREQELKQTKKIVANFFVLLVVSVAASPFSLGIFMQDINNSGFVYFIQMIISNLNILAAGWQNFALALMELAPLKGIALLTLNLILLVFTIRLFIYKKGLLLNYLFYKNSKLII